MPQEPTPTDPDQSDDAQATPTDPADTDHPTGQDQAQENEDTESPG